MLLRRSFVAGASAVALLLGGARIATSQSLDFEKWSFGGKELFVRDITTNTTGCNGKCTGSAECCP